VLNAVLPIFYTSVREQHIENKNVGKLTGDELRALEVPIGKVSLFRDTWRALAREASNSKLVILACACSLIFFFFQKCNFSHFSKV